MSSMMSLAKPRVLLPLLTIAMGLAAGGTSARAQSLEGSWTGGGAVTFFTSGDQERARCRAHYSRRSRTTYVLNATCATASGRASQSAVIRQVSENRYAGNFYNSEYDIRGRIFVVVRGSTQTVNLTSRNGSGSFRLSR
jgi:hypothetical protein